MLTPSFSWGTLEVALHNCMWSSVTVMSMQRWTSSRKQVDSLRNCSRAHLIFSHLCGVKHITFTSLGTGKNKPAQQGCLGLCGPGTIHLWCLVLCPNTVSLPPIIIKVIPQTDQKLSIEKGHFSFLFRQTMSCGRLGKMLYNEIMKPAIWMWNRHSPLLCLWSRSRLNLKIQMSLSSSQFSFQCLTRCQTPG